MKRNSEARATTLVLITSIFLALALVAHYLRPDAPAEDEPSLEEKLDALGYVEWVHGADASQVGVVLHDAAASADGLNIYNTPYRVILMEMDGADFHVWQLPSDGWPFSTAVLAPWGDLLAVGVNRDLFALDWNGGVLWRYRANAHHAVDFDVEGRLHLLTRGVTTVSHEGRELRVITDYIDVLSRSGERLARVPLHEIFADRVSAARWAGIEAEQGNKRLSRGGRRAHLNRLELFHTNSLRIIDRDVAGVARRGDALISLRFIDTIAIVDLEEQRARWSWGPGHVEEQHDAQLLEDGTILLFDNGTRRGFSRVLQVDPRTYRIVWEYRGDPPESFYSEQRGAAQRLANGNTLITNSENAYAFEVTPEGRRVWEFHNPEIKSGPDVPRRGIYRMRRLERPYVELARRRSLALGSSPQP